MFAYRGGWRIALNAGVLLLGLGALEAASALEWLRDQEYSADR